MLDEIASRLNLLEMKCRQPVEHLLAGEYRSVFCGRGLEFEDVRLYEPGDDIRMIDWKVTARTGEVHVKRNIEEREQFIYLLVDMSASMLHSNEGRKRQTMTEVCTLLTMAAIKNQDRVGLILFTDRIEHVISPSKGRTHAMRIMDQLMHFEPQGKGTDFVEMLGRFGHMTGKHSIAFVVSDFLAQDYALELQALSCKHDINAIHISESSLKDSKVSGLIRMEDAEDGSQRVVDSKVLKQEAKLEQRLEDQMLDSGVGLLNLPVGADCVQALAGFFHSRQRRGVNKTWAR